MGKVYKSKSAFKAIMEKKKLKNPYALMSAGMEKKKQFKLKKLGRY